MAVYDFKYKIGALEFTGAGFILHALLVGFPDYMDVWSHPTRQFCFINHHSPQQNFHIQEQGIPEYQMLDANTLKGLFAFKPDL